jgi:Domain of unknown function (DUF2019)
METETMTKIKDIESALKSFEAAADKQAEATEQGDYKTANKNYDIIIAAIEFLKEHNRLILLDEFLNHSSVGVRLWAASYLLNIKKDEAVKTLIAIARSGGIHSLTAGTTLSEWKKRNLKS